MISLFGEWIVKEDGSLDRETISKIVFEKKEMLEKLNGIIHPAVKRYIKREIKRSEKEGTEFFFIEAALLIEDNYDEIYDEMWYVYVDTETRMKRLSDGRGYSEEKSRSIMRKQLSDEVFFASCQRVIDNSTDVECTRQQVKQALLELEILEKDH